MADDRTRKVFFRNREGFIISIREMSEYDVRKGYCYTYEAPKMSFSLKEDVTELPGYREKRWDFIDWRGAGVGVDWVDAVER